MNIKKRTPGGGVYSVFQNYHYQFFLNSYSFKNILQYFLSFLFSPVKDNKILYQMPI